MKIIFLFAMFSIATEVKGQDTLRESMDTITLHHVEREEQYPVEKDAWTIFFDKEYTKP